MSVQLYNPTTDELTQVAGEEFNDTVIRVSALPSATTDLINETYLLVADQTGYTRGGIYQCQYINDAFTWVLVNGSGMTVDAVEDGNMNGVTSNAVAQVVPSDASASNMLVTSNTLNGFDIRGNSGGEAQQYGSSWMEVAKVETVAGAYARNSVIFLFTPVYGGTTKFGMVFVDMTKSSTASELINKAIAVSDGLEATDFGADIEWNNNVPTLTLRCKAPKNYAYYNIKVLSYSDVKPTLVNTVLNPTVAPTSIAPSEVVKV